ncbi:acyl-CoA dehydrogenase family protein [Nocardioides ferulae]|uniref:acyl-CoA dehydrogenase family protein n=1 Tax=Nocardioides ferulae TaxID=2340821 RepID=UPI000EB53EB4|nr:acyl-CoA dehydrogenase family protein [Nocardioides ferulae]
MLAPPASVNEATARADEIARDVLAPMASRTDQGVWPVEGIAALKEAGLAGLVVPREHGGAGLGLRAVAGVCESLGLACASTALCFGMHLVATAVLAAKATPRQTELYLEPIAAGEHLTTLALSETGTGSQFWLPQTKLTTTGDGWRVEGQKSFVTNGGQADSYVVSTMAADPDAPLGEFSCVIVPVGSQGLRFTGQWEGVGMRGNSSLTAELEGVEVDADHLLGAPGDQIWYVFEMVAPNFLTAMAGVYLGVAQASLEEATAHLSARRHSHSGRSLASEPVLQHRIGGLWAEVQATRRLVYWAAEEAEVGGPEALPALAAAKATAGDTAVAVANEAMTLLGGMGYRDRSPVERHLRDARAAHVMSPTTDILRTWTGRAVLGLPLLGT